jgi:ThiS family.
VGELFEILERDLKKRTAKELKDSLVLVNEKNFVRLKKEKTPLKDGDTVIIMSPASGG